MPKTPSVYIRDNIDVELSARGDSRSQTINRDLERLYFLYKRALAKISFTKGEAWLIVDALNGAVFDARSASMLWASIEDSIKLDGTADKWNVDGPVLVKKLQSLSELECLAVIDAVERFWSSPTRDQTTDKSEVKKFFNISEG